mgnify:CR=1 FL=1
MFDKLVGGLVVRNKIALLLILFAIPLGLLTYHSLRLISTQEKILIEELDGVAKIALLFSEAAISKSPDNLLAAQKTINKIASTSNLSLDSQLESYTLAQVISLHIPDIAEHLSYAYNNLNDTGIQSANKAVLEYNTLPDLFDSISQSTKYLERLSLSEKLKSKLSTISARQNELHSKLIEAANSPKAGYGPALLELSSLMDTTAEVLTELLKARLAEQHDWYRLAGLITLISVTTLPLISWSIVQNITARLRALQLITARTANDCDLSLNVMASGSDEIFQLSQTFNSMIGNLRGMVHKVAHSGSLVSTSTVEIAAVSKQQQATSSEIATTTAQIEATSKQIASTSEHLSKTMQTVQLVASDTAELANAGQSSLERMRHTMDSITDASDAIAQKLNILNDKASKIGAVVTTIAKVAEQTNLLSLNAAIEAEKAGEFGHGFSVVAREIRRLADQTAVSTIDIENMVREIQSAVSAGVMGMEKFASDVRHGANDVDSASDQLSTIITQIQTLTPSFQNVTEGMESQVISARQITDSLSQLSTAARQTADSLSQSNQSIDQLHQATLLLEQEVKRFHIGDTLNASA